MRSSLCPRTFRVWAVWCARVNLPYEAVCKLKVLVVTEKEADDYPEQSCVTTDLAHNHVERLDSPGNFNLQTRLLHRVDKFIITQLVKSLDRAGHVDSEFISNHIEPV